jgi:hypothetical protein
MTRRKHIRHFYEHMKAVGIRFELDRAGSLVVKDPDKRLSPVAKEEIVKRRGLLVKLVELDGLLGRPLLADESARCRQLAQECGVTLSWERLDLNTHEVERDTIHAPEDPDGTDEQEMLHEMITRW